MMFQAMVVEVGLVQTFEVLQEVKLCQVKDFQFPFGLLSTPG